MGHYLFDSEVDNLFPRAFHPDFLSRFYLEYIRLCSVKSIYGHSLWSLRNIITLASLWKCHVNNFDLLECFVSAACKRERFFRACAASGQKLKMGKFYYQMLRIDIYYCTSFNFDWITIYRIALALNCWAKGKIARGWCEIWIEFRLCWVSKNTKFK